MTMKCFWIGLKHLNVQILNSQAGKRCYRIRINYKYEEYNLVWALSIFSSIHSFLMFYPYIYIMMAFVCGREWVVHNEV